MEPSAERTIIAVHPVFSLGKTPQNSPLSSWGKVLAKNNFILFEDGWQRKQVDGISNNKPMTHFWGPETVWSGRVMRNRGSPPPPPSGTPVQPSSLEALGKCLHRISQRFYFSLLILFFISISDVWCLFIL